MQWSLYGMSYITISCIFGSSTMLTGGWYIEPKCPLREFVRNIHIWPRWEAKANIIIFEENHRVSYIPSSQKGVWFSCLHLKLRLTLLTFLCFFLLLLFSFFFDEEGLYRLKPVIRLSTTWSKIARKIARKIIGYIYRLHNQNVNGKLDFLCCAYLLSLQSEVWQALLKITAR